MEVSFFRPIDQFSGQQRLLEVIKASLSSHNFSNFYVAVAFAKSGPLRRLTPLLDHWSHQGKRSEAIIGISHRGTSKQALELALDLFDVTYITHPGGSTFHPKYYMFSGEETALCLYGSHNLTVGGLETNLEGGVQVSFDLASDSDQYAEALDCWESLLPHNCAFTKALDQGLLDLLVSEHLVFDESTESRFKSQKRESATTRAKLPFSQAHPKPPSPLPKSALKPKTTKKKAPAEVVAPAPTPAANESLLIQIVPHHNGEVFLSKTAVNQDPSFFGFPFTGQTIPKNPSNPPYPQRDPDPIVDVSIYDSSDALIKSKQGYGVNTVYYEKKGEIRITLSPDLTGHISPYSILHLQRGDEGRDYYMDIYNPGSNNYAQLLGSCNQTLPSGGATQARRMGWL